MSAPAPFSTLAKAIIERALAGMDDPADQKHCVMVARKHGIFTDQEAADWLAICQAQAA